MTLYKKIKIVSKANCPACDSIKSLVYKEQPELFGEVEVLTIHEDISIEELTTMIGYAPRSVPQVFIDDKHIGGNTHVRKMISSTTM